MTEFLSTTEIHEEAKELLREDNPIEIRNKAQRERFEADIDLTIRRLEGKFKLGTNGHALIDFKNKSIKSVTHDHETNTKDLDFTEDLKEENQEEITTMNQVAELMKQSIKHHRGEA